MVHQEAVIRVEEDQQSRKLIKYVYGSHLAICSFFLIVIVVDGGLSYLRTGVRAVDEVIEVLR